MKLWKRKPKKKLSPQEKESKIITIIARILTIVTVILCVIFASNSLKDDLDIPTDTITALTPLLTTVSPNFITTPIPDAVEEQLIKKLNNSGFDLTKDSKISIEKYSSPTIALTHNVSFTVEEFAFLYNSIKGNADKYNTILKSVQLSRNGDDWSLNVISTISLNALYTSKIENSQLQLPERVYLTTVCNYTGGVYSYDVPLFNELSVSESQNVLALIKEVNNVSLNRYVSDLIFDFAYQLGLKANATYNVSDGMINFIINN